VIDDADTAQARELLQSLHTHVDEISRKVESPKSRTRRVQGHAAVVARRRVASLRHELYEAHRLIDGLHRRFPDARQGESPGRVPNVHAECPPAKLSRRHPHCALSGGTRPDLDSTTVRNDAATSSTPRVFSPQSG